MAQTRPLVREDAAVSVGKASFPMFGKGLGTAAVPTFTIYWRVAFGHSLSGAGPGDFSTTEFYTRHQVLVKCLTAFAAAAGLHVANEVQIDGRQRPADIFVDRWTTADPAAIDVTVSHPLAPSLGLNVRAAKELATTKEKQKIAKYAHLIAEKQLHFIPVAITT